ncbi:DUF4166 domain-containing protein [Radiobacillus sp. PE A8.2]|uniref:DUF4166 domain-containing protein n=1 Tax=Radiobacillus sp. PE A8.2 TaxID=3380349 RepID=UPI00388E2B89
MTIYKQAMGFSFERLHPMLQQRYSMTSDQPFKASGVMRTINGGPKLLYPLFRIGVYFKLLFPEKGRDVPFTIENTVQVGKNGEAQVHWQRIFSFGNKRRYFNAVMSLDAERAIIKDYLGEPSLVYSDLAFHVSEHGGLTITSEKQRFVLHKLEIPLPKIFQGLATVNERYNDEKQVFEISVQVTNPLVGKVFAYEGEFTETEQL